MKALLQQKWALLADKINARNTRERALIAVSCWAIIYLVWDFAFFQPLNKQKEALQQRFEATNQTLVQLDAQQQVFVRALSSDPNAGRRREIVALKESITVLDNEINRLSDGLIPAPKLPQLLHDVLRANNNLKLVSMRTQPAELFWLPYHKQHAESLPEEDSEEFLAALARTEPKIFKHAVKLALEGSYFDVMLYLDAVEKLEWKVYWDVLDYKVENYPAARVELNVYTLSTEKGVFGA